MDSQAALNGSKGRDPVPGSDLPADVEPSLKGNSSDPSTESSHWERRRLPDRRIVLRHVPGGRRASDQRRDGLQGGTPSDRRREPRYLPTERRAYLGWWEREAFRTIEARTENFSRSGASLLVEEFPAWVGSAWLCPIGMCRVDWYVAQVVGVAPSGGAGRLVRIQLVEPLPYDVFKAIVWGFPAELSAVGPESFEAGPGAPGPTRKRPIPARGGRVLIVEADMATRFALRLLFRSRGWEVAVAAGRNEALASLESAHDWLILNAWLPDGDSATILRAAREAGIDCRVALLAPNSDAGEVSVLQGFSPDLLVPTPIDFGRLLAACTGAPRNRLFG